MHRSRDLFVIRKTNTLENADLYRTNWRKCYFDALSFYLIRYSFLWRTGKHSNHKLYLIFQQCGIMGSCLLNFLLVKVIDEVGFLSFFLSFTRTTIKIPEHKIVKIHRLECQL